MMGYDCTAQPFTQVPQKVPAVRDLHGLRSGPACSFGVDPATVAADDLRPWMLSEPLGHAVRIAIRQQVDHLARFEIAQDRAVAMAFAPGPVVDAKHARSSNQRLRTAMMKFTQQRRPARQQTQTYPKSRPRSTAQGKGKPTQRFARPAAPSAVACHRARQRFREDLVAANRLYAEEPTRLQPDRNRNTIPWEVGQPSNVPAMNLPRGRSAG